MGYTLDRFAAECRGILAKDPGPEGRKRVCALVQDVLKDEAFVAKHLTDDAPERKVLYEDPELGFCILGHVYGGAKDSPPHDHGPSWAIYGQASGETIMSDYAAVERPHDGKPGKARYLNSYTLNPGMAHVYNEGDLHSPRREAPTRLLRIEGQNMDKVKRYPYERV
jgi:predicted metal-dependent enzyme (double-stranded beta helix superfamily)